MPVTIAEKYDSREATEGAESPAATLLYIVQGTEDDDLVRAAVEGEVPALYQGLVFEDYHIAHLGGGVWDVAARYGKRKQPGESSFSFDTGGGTQHITQSVLTVARYPAAAPNLQGAIGFSGESVQGTDITVPVYNFTETHYLPVASVTAGYKATLFSLTGRVNNGAFKGFSPGEVLFLGASGSQRGDDDWEITFRFAASPNVTGLAVGSITGITKRGWDYLWVLYADAEDQNVLVKRPAAVYVEQVYEFGNLGLLGIGA